MRYNASSAEELATVLEKLQQLLGEAAAGSEDAQAKLARAGVTSTETGEAFLQASRHIASLTTQTEQAAAVTDLFGDRARGLAPAITASADAQETMNQGLRDGTIASGELVAKYGELNDKQALLNEQSKALASEGLVHIETAWTNITTATQRALGLALKYIAIQGDLYEAQRKFWARLFTEPQPPGSGEPGASGDWSGPGGSASFRSAQDVGLDWRPEPTRTIPQPTARPKGLGGGTRGRTGGAATREPGLGLELGDLSTVTTTGLPLKDVQSWSTHVQEASYEFKQMQAVGDDFYANLAKITDKTKDNTTATTDYASAWDKVSTVGTEAVRTLADGLSDILVEGGKVDDVLEGITKQLAKSTLSTSLQLGLDSLFSKEKPDITPGGTGASGPRAGGLLSGAGGWFSALFSGSKESADALTKSGADLTRASGDLTNSATSVGKTLPGIFESILGRAVGQLDVKAAVVNVEGGGSAGGSGGGFLGALQSIFGGGSGGGLGTGVSAGGSPGGSMGGYEFAGSSEFLVAKGAAFERGNVIPFARGGVVHRPTLFPMKHGTGLMGEAGPEAVLPLRRLSNGNLGVGAAGGPAVVNNVTVVNNAGAKVSTEERENDQGGTDLTVVIDQVEQAMAQRMTRPGTTLNRALSVAANPVRAR